MQLLHGVVGGGVVLSLLGIGLGATRPSMTLKQAAGEKMLIGAAVTPRDFEDEKHAGLLAEQFNSLTAENDFKPASLQPERGKFTFENADKIADFAQKHGQKLIGHTLLWHNQSPAFLFQDENKQPLPREKALENLKTHIDMVVKHFGDKVVGWDVVNEAIADEGEYLRDTPARKAIGDDFVVQAFKLAQAANPDVELYYNDYNIEAPYKRPKALRLIKELKEAGCRVDGVGIQGHWLIDSPSVKEIDESIRAYADLGMKVMITELDVDVLPRKKGGADVSATEKGGLDPYQSGLPADVQQKLAKRYRELFTMLAKHRDAGTLTRVTFWGFYDGHTWLNDWPTRGRTNHPMPWDRQLKPKPALSAIVEALQATPKPKPSAAVAR
jgi:endo-1,4-beta-xylanase